MPYDPNNVFARIVRGEISCKKVLETEHSLAFHDIDPKMPVHVLVIPKGPYLTLGDLAAQGSEAELADFVRAIAETARQMGVAESGYRIIANNGADAHQEVPHLHVHVFGGKPIGGRMIKAD